MNRGCNSHWFEGSARLEVANEPTIDACGCTDKLQPRPLAAMQEVALSNAASRVHPPDFYLHMRRLLVLTSRSFICLPSHRAHISTVLLVALTARHLAHC
jgi:hypothetical protein